MQRLETFCNAINIIGIKNVKICKYNFRSRKQMTEQNSSFGSDAPSFISLTQPRKRRHFDNGDQPLSSLFRLDEEDDALDPALEREATPPWVSESDGYSSGVVGLHKEIQEFYR